MSSIPSANALFRSKSARAVAVALRRTSETQTIYMSSGKLSFPVVLYSCAFVNLFFWGNLSVIHTWSNCIHQESNKDSNGCLVTTL